MVEDRFKTEGSDVFAIDDKPATLLAKRQVKTKNYTGDRASLWNNNPVRVTNYVKTHIWLQNVMKLRGTEILEVVL